MDQASGLKNGNINSQLQMLMKHLGVNMFTNNTMMQLSTLII